MGVAAHIHNKYYGPEPDFSKDVPDKYQLWEAYNWYNHRYSSDEAKDFVSQYLKKQKHKGATKVHYIPGYNLQTIGWNCRILLNGGKLPEEIEKRMWANLESMIQNVMAPVVEVEEEKKPVVSVQDRVANKASELMSEIEAEIDTFIMGEKSTFNIRQFFMKNEVKAPVAKIIAEKYKRIYSEMYDAMQGKDKELVDAYSHMRKPILKSCIEFIKDVIGTAEERIAISKASRKPRKKKEKPAAVLVAKLQYKEKDGNLSSIKPTDIIGSAQLWIYNTVYRNLTMLNAMGPSGLSVKGTTITGFDPKTSVCKKIRKPEKVLPQVLSGGKVALRKIMDSIKTKPAEAKGRINKDVILLRALK